MRSHILWKLSLTAAALVGCATTLPTPDQVSAPPSAISAAKEAGAQEIPQASLHLKMAEDQYGQAQRLIKDNQGERAARVLERAFVDARLALELARLEDTRHKAEDALRRVQEIQDEQRRLP